MLSKEELADEVKAIVDNDDQEKLELLIKMISQNYNYEWFDLTEDVFLGDYLDQKTKIKFGLLAMKYRSDNKEGLSNLFTRQMIPYILVRSVKENKSEFVRMLNEQPEMQEIIVEYFKEDPGDAIEIWDTINNLPITKREILEDEDFVAEKMREETMFFKKLPKGYEHLISYYNSEFNDIDYEYLQSLYRQYYEEVTDNEERTKLVALQYYLKTKQGLSPRILMQPLNFILKGIKRDSELFENIEKIAQNTKMNFIQTSLIVYNYRDSKLLKELIDNKDISDEIREKLNYLAGINRVININSLEDLERSSMEDIKNMEREVIYVSDAFGRGGPVSKTNSPIFPGSTYREVRIINPNGEMRRMLVGAQEGHDEKVKELYSEEIEFSDTCKTAFNRSIEAAKQISAVTLVIESEQCHMYMPSDISRAQVAKCLELVDLAIDNGKFGLAIYDRKTDKRYVASIDLFDKEETKRFITKLDEKSKSEEKTPATENSEER